MDVKLIVLPICATNCYVVCNEETNEGFVVDPGSGESRLIEGIDRLGMTIKAVLLTHGHVDHAGSAAEVAEYYKVPVYAYEGEKETLEDPQLNLSGNFKSYPESYKADIYLKDEQELDIAGMHIRCLATPGHTAGGCCFYLPYENTLFSGDTLFYHSVGRTDFPGGSMSQLVNGIRSKLMTLPEKTVVYPGHDMPTDLEEERINNPFL